MAKTNNIQLTARERQHRSEVRRRIASYPTADWLGVATPATEATTVTVWTASQDEDFPSATPAQFVQDLHKIARDASQRAEVDGETTGFRVRTSTAHDFAGKALAPNEVAFWFYRDELADCPKPNPGHQKGGATPSAAGADPERARAWHEHRTAAYYCTTPERGTHVRGTDSGCPVCPGTTAELLPEEPPTDWNPA